MPTRIIIADVLDGLAQLSDESVHCVVTSPPYWGLRDYGVAGQIGLEPTPAAFVVRMVEVFRGVRRVLRKDGTLWLNLGDSYAAGGMGAGSGKQLTNRGTSAGGHMDKARKAPRGFKPKDLMGMPWRVAFALQADGWWLRSDIIWSKPNPMPESVTDRPTKAHEYVFLLTKAERYYYDAEAIKEAAVVAFRERTKPDGESAVQSKTRGFDNQCSRNKRSVWTIATAPFPEAHFATFPPELPKICIRAGCPAGGVVLDPFAGAGTTLLAADLLQHDSIGIELNHEYAAMAARRCKANATMYPRRVSIETLADSGKSWVGQL